MQTNGKEQDEPLCESSSSLKIQKKSLQNLQLNTNKAGMNGLDTAKINDIIQKASEGSKFYIHKQKCQEKMLKLSLEMEESRDLTKTIVHIDMDMFYAAVEMRDDPTLRDKPMAVGGNAMLSTSNYAARKFGVRAAMPGFIAKKLCPNLIIVPCNFSKYKKVSKEIQKIFEDYDPQFSPMSLDEAYLDITEYLKVNEGRYKKDTLDISPAELVVEEIRKKIEENTQLTASAGMLLY
ncbi:Tyrosine-protein phosphatase non-receptor type 12 [Armadillidium vulgare]|nr:Tyrosine-protein phosphatase non-receptor type 12 [Armadillidium vulgare]